jgi:hypothetical protein
VGRPNGRKYKDKDGPGSLGLGVRGRWAGGVRRNGTVWPHAQRTAERREHTCSALLPRQRIGSEVVAICLCSVIKLNINMAVAGINICEIWLSSAIKIMALHATPLEFLPHAQDMH